MLESCCYHLHFCSFKIASFASPGRNVLLLGDVFVMLLWPLGFNWSCKFWVLWAFETWFMQWFYFESSLCVTASFLFHIESFSEFQLCALLFSISLITGCVYILPVSLFFALLCPLIVVFFHFTFTWKILAFELFAPVPLFWLFLYCLMNSALKLL